MKISPIWYVLSGFVILRMMFSWLTYHLIGWDESVYLSMGRFIHTFGEHGLWEVIRPLGLPAILSILPNTGYIILSELIILVFSLGCIYLTYKITLLYTNEKAAILAASLLALTPLFFYYSFLVYTDIPAAFLVLLAIYMFLNDRLFWAGSAAGLAFVFRFPAGIILIALLTFSFDRNIRHTLLKASKVTAAFILTVLPYFVINQIYTFTAYFPVVEAMKHQNNMFFEVSGIAQNIFYYPFILAWQNPLLILLIAAFIFFHRKLGLVYFIFMIFLVYFTRIVNKQPRFMLLFLPLAVILAAYGLARIQHKFKFREIQLAVGIFLILSLCVQSYVLYKLYKAQLKTEPEIVSEYYRYGYEGIVLTTDPLPAIYSDKAQFIPAYGYVSETYDKLQKTDWDYFIWYPAVMPCFDQECEMTRSNLVKKLAEEELVLNKSYFYEERRVYHNIKNVK
jgi:hypothetical protein